MKRRRTKQSTHRNARSRYSRACCCSVLQPPQWSLQVSISIHGLFHVLSWHSHMAMSAASCRHKYPCQKLNKPYNAIRKKGSISFLMAPHRHLTIRVILRPMVRCNSKGDAWSCPWMFFMFLRSPALQDLSSGFFPHRFFSRATFSAIATLCSLERPVLISSRMFSPMCTLPFFNGMITRTCS